MKKETAIIIGAGPAGLTAAYEFLTKTNIKPIVIEKSDYMGGIARTVNYKGNRIDIGGHRFFSKSDKVMQWWLNMLPLQETNNQKQVLNYQNQKSEIASVINGLNPDKEEKVMLLRLRKSRIYFLRRFFNYPISLSKDTIMNLGLARTFKIGVSYAMANLFPIKPEENLEQFFINRFGNELYKTFFKSYTEKVWGVSCKNISAEWGAQRIKGLSLTKAIQHFIAKSKKNTKDFKQKEIETSLIDQFLYPKYGPGQLWEETAKKIKEMGGIILTESEVNKVYIKSNKVVGVDTVNLKEKKKKKFISDYFISTMPIQQLVSSMVPKAPKDIIKISNGLVYRDFITVGLLLNKLKIYELTEKGKKLIKDNWIYIQEPDVLVGRMQIFNNWSPYMVSDKSKVWIGLEYFCNVTDPIWKKSDKEMTELAIKELDKIGIIEKAEVVDSVVIHMEKTYPAYFGSYGDFPKLRKYLDGIENLFLVGRNGMHKYNNQDHSMLTAMTTVENIQHGIKTKENIWSVNTEQEYHEEKSQKIKK